MKVSTAVRLYVAHKRSMGWQFEAAEKSLLTFSRTVGDIHLSSVTTSQVSDFMTAPKASPYLRYATLRPFFKHWKARGQLNTFPLPAPIPHERSRFVPYIYSRMEIRRLVNEPVISGSKRRVIDPLSFRTLLLFLYGTGVMLREALTLREVDVDLKRDVVTVQRKFRARKRTIPIGPDVHKLLTTYLESPIRKKFKGRNLFLTRKGTPVNVGTLDALFQVIRRNANVVRFDGSHFQPRLHDLRSTFAVHRIAAWYEQGADAQELLPALGAYLGQFGLVSMNRHLLLTPEHYRKHLAAESKLRDSRKRVSNASPLMVELLKKMEIA